MGRSEAGQQPAGTRRGARADVDPVLQFMRLMWEVDHELQRLSKSMEARIGLTSPQRLALRLISQQPGLSAGELAMLLHLDPGTVTGIVSRLEAGALIERRWDPADGRRTQLMLTPAGRTVNRRRAGTLEAAIRTAWRDLQRRDRDGATRMLTRLAVVLRRTAQNHGARTRTSVRGAGRTRQSK